MLVMEISQAKEKVNKAEQDILQILNRLSYETGVKVESLELTSYSSFTKTGITATSVTDIKITMTL
jgi:hypothetical protein